MHCTLCVRIANSKKLLSIRAFAAIQNSIAHIWIGTKTCSCCERRVNRKISKFHCVHVALVLCAANWNEMNRTRLARRAFKRNKLSNVFVLANTHTHNIMKIAKRTRRARRYYIFYFFESCIWNIEFCIFRHCSRCRLLFLLFYFFESPYVPFSTKGSSPEMSTE